MSKQNLGWVYILTNPAFKEGMIKIGFTSRDTPQERAEELSGTTGVPTKFTVVWAARMPDAQSVERTAHRLLQSKRSNGNREFFECSVAEAVHTIESVAGKNIVKTLDYRKGQPEKASSSSSSSTKKTATAVKQPPKVAKKKTSFGIVKGLLMLGVLFLLAMLIIGWFAEKRETAGKPQPIASPNQATATATAPNPTTTPTAPSSSQHLDLGTARQNMQLAWDKIPDDIQKDLQSEQTKWLKDLTTKCGERSECLIPEYEQRAAYLKGFSIR